MTLPAKSKTNISSQKNILIGCGIGGAAAVIILVITMVFPGSTVTSDNSILVDPTKEGQSLFVIARVMIQNTGNQPITNITCLLYTSPSPRDLSTSRMPSSA